MTDPVNFRIPLPEPSFSGQTQTVATTMDGLALGAGERSRAIRELRAERDRARDTAALLESQLAEVRHRIENHDGGLGSLIGHLRHVLNPALEDVYADEVLGVAVTE
jgi:hypothetical protein